MKPGVHHYFLAHTSLISMGLGAAGAIALVLFVLNDERAFVADLKTCVWILIAVIIAAFVGVIFGVTVIWQILFSRIAARIQGWPFQVGDEVVILIGEHKHTKTKVYEIWAERGQVRVDLGDDLKYAVKDVFCAVQVCKSDRVRG